METDLPKNEKYKAEKFTNRKTGEVCYFKCYQDAQLAFMNSDAGNKLVGQYDMSKLELEYDYETDEEQLIRAKKLLKQDCIQAFDFFVKEDPVLLVGNLDGRYEA